MRANFFRLEGANMKRLRRILLAEDNQYDIELALAALTEKNLAGRVDVVHDGVEVLDYLCCRGQYTSRDTGNPGVLLLDLKMPKRDGLEVLQEMKSSIKLKYIPVVVLTSSCQEQDLVESYYLGASAFVVKPVRYDEFFSAIRALGVFWAELNEPPPDRIRE